MNTPPVYACLCLLLHAAAAGTSHAGTADELSAAITGGTSHLTFRYRDETVDENTFDDDAVASTLRTRFTAGERSGRGGS